MAWTTPRCWTTGEVVTAAIMNAHVRDNLNVTSAGVVTAAGDIAYASAAHTMARVAKGTNGNILHQASCAPAWTASPSFTGLTLSGALDVNGTIDYDGTDVDMLSSGDIDLVSSSNAAAAIYIAQSTGTSGTIKIHADTGTSVTEGAESINILSDVGGIGLRSTANLANAINLTVDGGTTSSMTLFNDQGTGNTEGSASIQLLSDAGGINIKSTADLAGSVRLTADGGTSETIILHADQGTSVTEGAESISLLSDAGGIGLRSTANLANAINLTVDSGTTSSITVFNDTGTSVTEGAASIAIVSDAGGVELRSTANLANAINITSDGGTTGTISIFNDLGSSVTEGAESISLLSDAGGVGIRSTANLANAVNITADGGTTSTIQIYNDQGTAVNEGVASVQLLSDVGGIGIKSGLNAAGAIRLTADAGTSETIILHADQGSGTDSIHLLSDAGGITLNPGTFVTIGGIADGEIRLFEDTGAGCNYAAIKVQNMSASYTLTLPADDGCCGEALTTNGSGTLTWAAAGGTTINNATENELVTIGATTTELCAEANLTWDGTTLGIAGGNKILQIDGAFRVANGSAAAPGYAFTCDTDLGFYRVGANNMSLAYGCAAKVNFQDGRIHVNEDANASMNRGITINQLCQDDEILAFKSSDVAHGVTGATETDTYGMFKKDCASQGGLAIHSFIESNPVSFHLYAYANSTNATHTASGRGVIELETYDICGTGTTSFGSSINLLAIRNGGTQFIVDAEGDLFANGSATTVYDAYCDAQLARAVTQVIDSSGGSGLINTRWDDFINYNECTLIDLDLLGGPRIGVDPSEQGLINYTGMVRLHSGAIWQLHSKLADQQEEITALKGQLQALTGGK